MPKAGRCLPNSGRSALPATRCAQLGMRFNAGHALNYFNVQPVAQLPGIRELHIGHAIISRAVFVGLREAVREMKRLLREAQVQALTRPTRP
jgi:pyridoxine 5-phosphate synthase